MRPKPKSNEAMSRDLDSLQFQFARTLTLVARRWKARFDEEMKEVDQTHARSTTLVWIAASPPDIRHKDLAARVGVRTPTLVRVLDSLEDQGLLERRPSANDRRRKAIVLTKRGKAELNEIHNVGAKLVDQLLSPVDEARLAECLAVLADIATRLEPDGV